MKRDIKLEKEIENNIRDFNSEKKLPSAFSTDYPKVKLSRDDILLIILGVLFGLFILYRLFIVNIMPMQDRLILLNETLNEKYGLKNSLYPSKYENVIDVPNMMDIQYRDMNININKEITCG